MVNCKILNMQFSIESIILAVAISMVGTIIFFFVGLILAKSQVFDPSGTKEIGKLIYFVILPAFVLYNMAQHFTLDNLSKFWILPVFYLINLLFGLLMGYLIVYIFKPKEQFKRPAIICIAVSNNSSIPLHIAQVLFFQGPLSIFKNSKNSLAYISFYIVISELVIWLFVKKFMLFSRSEVQPILNQPNDIELPTTEVQPTYNICQTIWEQIRFIISPPIILALVGSIIGLISPIRNLFFGPDQPPLLFMANLIHDAGSGLVACLLLSLGMSFAKIKLISQQPILNMKLLIAMCLARLIFIPAIVTCIIYLFYKCNLLPDDPTLLMILLLESIPPTNIRILLLSQLEDYCSTEVSFIVLCMYIGSVITLPCWLIAHIYMLTSSWWLNL